MAVVTLKSNQITNRDATPKVLTDALISGGAINHSFGYVFTGAADSAASNYKLAQVPSDAQMMSLEYVNGALGSGCILDIAAWYPTTLQSGGGAFLAQSLAGAFIGSSAFVATINGNGANATWAQGLSTSAPGSFASPNYWEQPLWMLLGLSADPECVIDLGFSVRLAVSSAGYIAMKASYSY